MTLYKKGIEYVRYKFGEEYIQEFCDNYESLQQGAPIGGYIETLVFIELINDIKRWNYRKFKREQRRKKQVTNE